MAQNPTPEQAALAAFKRRSGDDDDKGTTGSQGDSPARRTPRKTPLSTEKVLNLPRTITIGGVEMRLKAFEVQRVKAVQEALWTMPSVVLSAALSSGSGIDSDEAFELFCSMDGEAESLMEQDDRPGAYRLWRLRWRNLSLSYDVLQQACISALEQLAVTEDEESMPLEQIEDAMSSSSLLLTDLVELLQTILDICGGFPGDCRSRF